MLETKETQVQSRGQEDPLQEKMAILSSTLTWMDRGGWWATVHGDTSEQLSMRVSHLEDYDFGRTKLIGKNQSM